MSHAAKLSLPMIAAAAICSGSTVIGLIAWVRSDAVRASEVRQHEVRISALEVERRAESRAVTVLQEDVRHIVKTVDEIKAGLKTQQN